MIVSVVGSIDKTLFQLETTRQKSETLTKEHMDRGYLEESSYILGQLNKINTNLLGYELLRHLGILMESQLEC